MRIETWASHEDQMCEIGKHQWSVARLIQLSKDLQVMDVPLDHMNVFHLYKSLTLREMVMHMTAVMKADLNFPIILDEDGEVMDGRHRIMKALYEQKPTIKAVRFDKNPEPCKINESIA